MKTITYVTADKSAWGPGPWAAEPDKIQWTDKKTQLPCLIVRNIHVTGALCGYVGVAKGHPLFAKSCNIGAYSELHVHGGITYAAFCNERSHHEDHDICHIPAPGEPRHVWWLGFDCSHAGDFSPKLEATLAPIRDSDPELRELHDKMQKLAKEFPRMLDIYRNIEYVRRHVRKLAAQLRAMEN